MSSLNDFLNDDVSRISKKYDLENIMPKSHRRTSTQLDRRLRSKEALERTTSAILSKKSEERVNAMISKGKKPPMPDVRLNNISMINPGDERENQSPNKSDLFLSPIKEKDRER